MELNYMYMYNRKNKKDEKIKEEMKTKKRGEKDNGMKEEDEKYERSIQSAERYQAWVEKKGKPWREPPPPTLTQRYATCTCTAAYKRY